MSVVVVTLDRARIGLWSDPSGQIEIPHLTGMPISRNYAGTLAQFAGDDFPTGFRGQSKANAYALTCRYLKDEQDHMLALRALFDTAHVSPDSRLLLRTHPGQVAGLNEAVAVQVFGVTETPGPGLVWDVSFTASVVQYSFAV